ncbi:MAG TPA: hypothetical protein VIZ65_01875 [Cellvibrionaceae bacterium]
MSVQRIFISLCLLFFCSLSFAQNNEEYQILSASYGTDAHNIEVTDELKALARQDRTVRVTNSLFGRDPDPGRAKMLRIFARGGDGRVRTFEYKEGKYIDGAQFSSWGNGNWGQQGWNGGWDGERRNSANAQDSGYVILQASYGTRDRNVDVTQRLRELARQNRTFRMGNNTFGVDPDPGRVKTLRVYTRGRNGENRTFEFSENSQVDGAQFSDWGGGNWGKGGWHGGWGDDNRRGGGRNHSNQSNYGANLTIISARYGEGNRTLDVTNRLRRELRDGRVDTTVDNYLVNADPAPGRVKYLTVRYSLGKGRSQEVRVREGEQLRLP